MIEETWNLFRKKLVALWELHKDGPGEAYLPAIYNNPELQQLVQNKYLTELFHDSLGFGAAKMIRFSPLLSIPRVYRFERDFETNFVMLKLNPGLIFS